MARRRLRAAARKSGESEAHTIASGVYTVAMDLRQAKLPLPVFVFAPLVYVSEMVAGVVCKRRGWGRGRTDQVARYLLAGLQEYTVALFERFDEQHFEAWIAAAEARQEE